MEVQNKLIKLNNVGIKKYLLWYEMINMKCKYPYRHARSNLFCKNTINHVSKTIVTVTYIH